MSADGERRGAFRRNLIESYMATANLGATGSALVLDISETGLGVQSVVLLNVGASSPVRFTLPQGRTIEGTGSVAWTDETGRAGIRLSSLSPASRTALAQWLASSPESEGAVAASDPVVSDPVAEAVAFLAGNRLELSAALAYVAEKAALHTRADGSALALQDGDGMVCRASVGTAPGIGVRLQGGSGLTGECIRTGAVVRCEDTEVDPRADRLLCRRINLRSTVIVPVISSGSVIGVLEALSSRPRAFDIGHVRCLVGLAELVSATLRPAVPAPPRVPARVLDPPAPPVATPAAAPAAARPAGALRAGAATAVAPALAPASQPKPVSKTLPVRPLPAENKPAAEVAKPRLGIRIRVRRVPRGAMLAIAGGAFALAAGGLYLQFHPEAQVPAVHAAAPAPAPAAVAPEAVAPAPAGATVTPTQLNVPPSPVEEKRREPVVSAAAKKPEPPAPPMALREPAAAPRQESAAIAPPSLELSGGAAPSLPSVPSTMPVIQAKISRGITEAKLLRRVDPVYPDVARQMHLEGNVEIRAVVGRDGVVKNPVAVSGPPVLRMAALAAVRKWRYEPSRLDGQPTERDLLITIAFHLPR